MKKFFRLHPMFILLGIFFICLGLLKIFLIYILVVIIHELAHAKVAQVLGYKLNKIYLLPFGAMLDINQKFFSPKDEIMVAIAGPVINFIIVILCLGLWWIFPETYCFTQTFVFCNIITGLINLLPCYPLDGGRILVAILSEKIKRKKALCFSYVFNYIFSILFLILFFINLKNEINISYALMAIFIFFGTINNKYSGNYSIFTFSNKTNNIYEVKQLMVNGNVQLYKIFKFFNAKKFNIVYVKMKNGQIKMITENSIEKYLEYYPANIKIEEILN